ncbi:hypothetical protein Tco_1543780 [Tanacetum coccineum]
MDPNKFKPQSLEQAPPSPDYVPGPKYSEYVAPSDDEIPVEDQPLPADASPIALLPGYVADFDPLEEDPEDDPEEDPTDYPVDGGDDDEEESSEDDDDEEKDFEEDEDEEKEHLAPADSVVLPAIDPVLLAEETKPFETDASAATPLPPPQTLSQTDIPEVEMPPQKRVCFTAPTRRFKVGESSTATVAGQTGHTLAHRVDYGFIDTLDAGIRASESRVMTAVEEVNERVTDLATTQGQDAHELYAWVHSEERSHAIEACIRTLEAQVGTLQTQHDRMEWQRQDTGDLVTKAFGHIYALKARDRAHPDDLKDTGSSC